MEARTEGDLDGHLIVPWLSGPRALLRGLAAVRTMLSWGKGARNLEETFEEWREPTV